MFPKIIWRYWEQGWDKAPFVIQECSKSVEHYAKDWEIVNLDNKSLQKYIELPTKLNEIENFPIQPKSDLIRILLLEKYGGVWIDATCFLNCSLSAFLSKINCDFFCFYRWPNKIAMSNWFLSAQADSYIAKTMAREYQKLILSDEFIANNKLFFSKWRGSPNYFSFHKLFESLASKDLIYREKIEEMPFYNSFASLQPALTGWNNDIDLETATNIINDHPIIKLSYSVKENDYNPNSVLGFLIKKMNGEPLTDIPHLHNASGLRTAFLYNSFLNNPKIVCEWAGLFESESDLNLCEDKYSRYHVFNIPSIGKRSTTQILIPYGSNRIFIRSQKGNSFTKARELAYKEEIDLLKKEIDALKNKTNICSIFNFFNFAKKIFLKIKSIRNLLKKSKK